MPTGSRRMHYDGDNSGLRADFADAIEAIWQARSSKSVERRLPPPKRGNTCGEMT
jgi:hypothetical protein